MVMVFIQLRRKRFKMQDLKEETLICFCFAGFSPPKESCLMCQDVRVNGMCKGSLRADSECVWG